MQLATGNIKSVLFAVCVVMVFTAQTKRPDDKGQPHAPAARQTAPHAPAVHNNQGQRQIQNHPQIIRKEAPRQVVHRAPPAIQTHVPPQASHQERNGPHVYAVPASKPVGNNRFLHRQHHNNWKPRYNFYGNQYHFYPYVNIASIVELESGGVVVGFDGQNYYYDQGTFYLQDQGGQYMAVAPPVGIIVPLIPADARQINAGGRIYYRYKGVFYVQLAQGYQVVGPVEAVSNDS